MQLACLPQVISISASPNTHTHHNHYKTQEGEVDVTGSLLFVPSLATFDVWPGKKQCEQ